MISLISYTIIMCIQLEIFNTSTSTSNNYNELVQHILIFFLSSSLPLLFGLEIDKVKIIRKLTYDLSKFCNLNTYKFFNDTYREIIRTTNNLKKHSNYILHEEYLFIRYAKIIMDLFHLDKAGECCLKKKMFMKLLSEFHETIKMIHSLEKENKSNKLFGTSEAKISVISKVISLTSFYNYYYNVDLSKEIININELFLEMLDYYKKKYNKDYYDLIINNEINLILIQNGYNFNEKLLTVSTIHDSVKSELKLFFRMKSLSMKFAQIINSRNKCEYSNIDILQVYSDFFNLNDEIKLSRDIIIMIYTTEIVALYDFLETHFKDINIEDSEKEYLNVKNELNVKKLSDYIKVYFKEKFRIRFKDFCNNYISLANSITRKDDYHPIFDLYLALNTRKFSGLDYNYSRGNLYETFRYVKPEFIKDIHIYLINEINHLIYLNQIEKARALYDEVGFDQLFDTLDNSVIYKYSILICKAVFVNRLNNDYNKSVELLQIAYSNTMIKSDENDSTELMFIFAFEKRDRILYRENYNRSTNELKKKLRNFAESIRIFGRIYNIRFGGWVYVSYPLEKGYILKDTNIDEIFTLDPNFYENQ